MTTMLADGNGRFTLWREGFLPRAAYPTDVDEGAGVLEFA